MGFPIVANGAVWSDGLFLPFILGFIVYVGAADWTAHDLILSGAFGIIGSVVTTKYVYLRGKFPDALAGPNGLSLAGAIHLVYMALGLMILYLFHFYGRRAPELIGIVSVTLSIHAFTVSHLPLQMLRNWKRWSWCPHRCRPCA